jgi:hypothetical protein
MDMAEVFRQRRAVD